MRVDETEAAAAVDAAAEVAAAGVALAADMADGQAAKDW